MSKFRVVNTNGMHLRAAQLLANLVGSFSSEVFIGCPGNMINATSIIGVTTLGATCGTLLDVVVEGPEADRIMIEIQILFENGFEEGVHWTADSDSEGNVEP